MPREPLAGGKGKRTPAEYTVELTPKQRLDRSVDVFRERPLPRGSVLALREAVFVRKRRIRGGTAEEFALCPCRDGGFWCSVPQKLF